jgi:glycosyltransferase involved in cell wall biosynthesis
LAPVRIALVAEQLLAPVPGGIGRYTRELGAALARTAAAGDSVTGWTAWHRDLQAARIDAVDGPQRLRLPRRALAAAWSRGLGPAPRGADVVHVPSLLVPPRRATPLVVSIHDAVPWTHPETLTAHGARWHVKMAERAVASGAAIGVLTRVVGDELLAVLPGLTADRIHVLGAGVSPALLAEPSQAQTAETRRRYELPDRFLLSLATLEPRKGLDVLVHALALLGTGAPPLVVAGQPGWGGVDLAATAQEYGARHVYALGKISDDDLAVVLRSASALVAPSRAEGFGLPVAEAMAVGTPVICSDAPALVEVAGGAALITPVGDPRALADAIDSLTSDDELRERLSAAGRERAVDYRWDAVASRAWRLYHDLHAQTGG